MARNLLPGHAIVIMEMDGGVMISELKNVQLTMDQRFRYTETEVVVEGSLVRGEYREDSPVHFDEEKSRALEAGKPSIGS